MAGHGQAPAAAARRRRRRRATARSRARPSARCSTRCYAEHGELRERIAGDDGDLRRFVNVYLDGEDIRFAGRAETPVPEGAELKILPAVAGG